MEAQREGDVPTDFVRVGTARALSAIAKSMFRAQH